MLALAAQPSQAAPSAATLLVAQLDSVSSYCSKEFPGQAKEFREFVKVLLSNASAADIAQARAAPDYDRLVDFDLSKIRSEKRSAAAKMCQGLISALATGTKPREPERRERE